MEWFLTALLRWPGVSISSRSIRVPRNMSDAIMICDDRIRELKELRGDASNVLMLPVFPSSELHGPVPRPLRACVAQMAVPLFQNGSPTDSVSVHDPEFNAPATRRQFRQHLTSMLAGVEQMLRVRQTHLPNSGLDLLILPELAVHPDDVRTRLLPFVRRHRCWVFTGLTYHRCDPNGPLVNSGMWIFCS